jgi:hypothetical protein
MNMQESRTPQQARSTGTGAQAHSGTPGLWPVALATVLSAVLCSVWLMSDLAAASAPDSGTAAVTSELASVDDHDIAGALTTMAGTPASLARFKQRADGCPLPLAWVTVTPAAGQPTGTIRLRSGSYYSPDFNLSDVPVRIAIPYPAPYEAGHGTLTALHSGGNATLTLRPAWHLTAQGPSGRHQVTWQPSQRCKQPNG